MSWNEGVSSINCRTLRPLFNWAASRFAFFFFLFASVWRRKSYQKAVAGGCIANHFLRASHHISIQHIYAARCAQLPERAVLFFLFLFFSFLTIILLFVAEPRLSSIYEESFIRQSLTIGYIHIEEMDGKVFAWFLMYLVGFELTSFSLLYRYNVKIKIK